MKSKPDYRKNNIERIQHNIDMTIKNYELGKEMMEKTSDQNLKRELSAKNQRRLNALQGMRAEMKDEAEVLKDGIAKSHY